MKKIMLFLIVFSVISVAQEQSSEEKVRTNIENLFSSSKVKNYKAVCEIMVNANSIPLNPKSESDLEKAERVAKKIKAYLDISDSYEIKSVVSNENESKKLVDAKVGFISGKQVLEINFKFVEVNNNFLLFSVD